MLHRPLTVALAALLAFASPAVAGERNPSWAGASDEALAAMAERHMDRLFERLHLSADQRAKMQVIRKRHQDATAEPRKRLMEKRKALFALVRGADATKDQAVALQREINSLQGQLSEARLAAWFEGRAVLTREQLKALAALPGGRPGHRP
ncbi:MAG: Heavy-metal resistance [Cyanobacteria bacterium RYN_339]|nr:Heavy-metal resistance [Cyanobacteria bacterium RYN_339]